MAETGIDGPDLNARQREILAFARAAGKVTVDPLARRYRVTPQTIRRDLNQLCALRLLQRVHGGAIASAGTSNLGYVARQQIAADAKAAIGARAARLVPNDSSLFVNIGTTTEQVARNLVNHAGLLVITNNLNVVNLLRPCDSIEVMIAGGMLRREDGGIVGHETEDFIARFKVDYAVIGVSAIEDDGTLLDFDSREVRVAKAIIANARSVIMVADAMKFERSAPIRIGNVADLDCFVTDRDPPAAFVRRCRACDVRVEVTGPASARVAAQAR